MTVPNRVPSTAEIVGETAQERGGDRRPLIFAGILLGASHAGFFDGIVLHQLLQWHHMFSNVDASATIAGMDLNTFGDGLLHLWNWTLNITGLIILWQALKQSDANRSGAVFWGALMLGFGLFNVTEGIIDHHLLQIHHVRSGPYQSLYDIGFLLINTLIAGLGWMRVRPNSVPAGESPARTSS